MAQKPITMEQLKQILQLKNDGISIREIARRTGISRNSVRKYLSQFDGDTNHLSNKELADKAYNNEQLESGTQRPELPASCSGMSTCKSTPVDMPTASTVISLNNI